MKSLIAWRWYVALFILCAGLGILIGGVGQMTIDNLKCQSTGYANDHFLAYCDSQRYADYEHGALFYGLERSAIDSIRSAEVLFIGNSKLQAAFSTKAVRDYFNAISVRFFVMGFGYGDESTFSLAVLRKWGASPKILVINADPFFSDKISQPARDALEGRPAFLWRLALKLIFQRVHRAVCLAGSYVCPESDPSIFRNCDGACGLLEDEVDFSPGRRPIDARRHSSQFGKRGTLVRAIRSSNDPDPAEMYLTPHP